MGVFGFENAFIDVYIVDCVISFLVLLDFVFLLLMNSSDVSCRVVACFVSLLMMW